MNLFVIDASGYLFRSYYAIGRMSDQEGRSTGALYGFIRSLLKIEKDFSPKHIVCVFEGADNRASRVKIYDQYKATRQKIPEDLPHQIEAAKEFCKAANIPWFCLGGMEADDTMASIAAWGKEHFEHIYLCTSDKDLAQMVSSKVSLLHTHKNNASLGPNEVEEFYGVPPEKMGDWLALCGDTSDNIPGIQGCGPKTATQLIKSYGSIENLYHHLEDFPEKKRELFSQEKENAFLSKQLVKLDLHAPINHDPAFYELGSRDEKLVQEFFQKYDFKSLLKELGPVAAPEEKTHYSLIDTEDDLKALIHDLKNAKRFAFDTETTHEHPLHAELVGIGFCKEKAIASYIPLNGKLSKDLILSELQSLFSTSGLELIGHNIKYDLHILENTHLPVPDVFFDTMVASYLLNAESHRHNLDHLAESYFSKKKIPIEDLIGKGKKQISMINVPIENVCTYCCEDVDYTFRLYEKMEKELQERGLTKLFETLEMPLLPILQRMERHGVYVSSEKLKEVAATLKIETEILEKEIYELAGEEFLISSPKQLSHILFEKMQIRPPKKTATGFSTNADVLESLKGHVPLAEKILRWRSLEKLRTTYAEALAEEIHPRTHRIHCTFNQSVAATGRLSCQNPNLQNIPIRTKEGKTIRAAFMPQKKGWSYISSDYSQIELRLLAHLSQDPTLLRAFREGLDIHSFTAALVYGVDQNLVTEEMRRSAKAVNFGIIYGQQAFGLSQELGISMKEASSFIKAYFERYPKVQAYLESCKQSAKETTKARSLFGRERLIPDINSQNGMLRSAAERLAVNTPIQGTAADIIKLAMIKIEKRMQEEPHIGFMMLQIHDELLFECPEEEAEKLAHIVQSEMEAVLVLDVPLSAQVAIGKNWEEC